MRKFWNTLVAITKGIGSNIGYFMAFNLRYIAGLIEIGCPYFMYIFGQYVALGRGKFGVGGELFIPALICALVYYMREVANHYNTGSRIPVPDKRFTEVDEDGMVSVPISRQQEMLLYIADLEDWMERKGWL